MKLAPYRKAIVAVGVAVAEFVRVTADGNLTQTEGITVLLALAGALGVYGVTNRARA